ncbi:transcriptional regulator [Actinoplanes lobatus]|uniref:Transcriptional regulator n=1 Tax=Actinoplanes lobatus TaxID=113568 RepID=A0A7W7HKQ8_9ACTN|nr:LacI family DNA-binding transcriptional regulator [Actinoplanes lobatus]MBB4752289.1 LacI family xylobiose transport system transcriptional regulator [Actinoplanes lobatus]GGN94222.1 transcriptional regulator [Actinoplanes lobatus]GIE45726.1 transcriptional regulator [Actinoplanes lobatus]
MQPDYSVTEAAARAERRGRRRGEMTVAAVARLAGVSKPTVSRVLNGKSGVAPDTRQRVEEVLREYGYRRPAAVAPSPGMEVVFFGLESTMAIEIMRGVQDVAGDRDLGVGFTDVAAFGGEGRPWAERLLARRPAGIIVVHSRFTAQQYAQLSASGIPLVSAQPVNPPPDAVPSVAATNWSGAVAATRHLIGLGHRRIALIGGPADQLVARERLEACRAAMETAGLPADPQLIHTGRFLFEDGLELGTILLRMARPPTAVLCGDDLLALGVYEAARRAGVHIPGDLSVVGFDGITATRWCGPPMTTVRQPFREIGAAAARLLLQLIMEDPVANTRVELPTALAIRASTAAPAPENASHHGVDSARSESRRA